MTSEYQEYLDFFRCCLNEELTFQEKIKGIDWNQMLAWAEQQAIVGIVYSGIQREGKALQIPFNILMEWIGYANQIEYGNKFLNDCCVKVVEMFENAGFDSCILKGQGNALMYPNPLSRTTGDIDVWVKPKGDGRSKKDEVRRIIEYVKGINPKGSVCYHHIDYGLFNGVEVEIHYRPSFMFNPIHNQRLQKWFIAHSEEQFRHEVELPDGVGKVAIPTPEFNIIFQLSHIYNHVLHEGIGLRQFVDYYFVLRQIEDPLRLPLYKGSNLKETLRHLGLWKFAGAVMYVMREVFALEEQYMIAPVDERRGKVLLQEIMRGGNFGKYDEANIKADSRIKKNIQRIRRDIRMMQYFPSECIWEPAFRGYHFFWRLAHR